MVREVNPNTERLVRLDWYDSSFAESHRTCHAAITGVAQAGAICGLALPITFGSMRVLSAIFSGDWRRVDEAFFAIFGGMCGGLFFGPLLALLASVPAKLIVVLLNVSLGYPLSTRTQIALVGGLAGFLAVSLFVVHPDVPLFVSATVILNAVACGHIGAMMWVRRAIFAVRTKAWQFSKKQIAVDPNRTRGKQFQIMHLLALTAWAALIFAIDRITETRLSICAGVYLLFQCTLLWFSKMRYNRTVRLRAVESPAQDTGC